jgi:hypothetical protein
MKIIYQELKMLMLKGTKKKNSIIKSENRFSKRFGISLLKTTIKYWLLLQGQAQVKQ